MTRRAEAAGADAVLSVVPYYNKPMQAGISRAFSSDRRLDRPSHHPARHSLPDHPRTIRRHPRAAGEIRAVHRIEGWHRRYYPPHAPAAAAAAGFRLLSGDDATALAFVANGGDGCISIVSNVAPDLCQAIFSSCRQGRLQSARYLQSRLAPLTAALAKESPAALKYALCLLGFMSPDTRLPIVELDDAAKAEVASAIAEIGDEDLACPTRAGTVAAFPRIRPLRRRGSSNECKRSRE